MKDIERFITGFQRFQEKYFGADNELFDRLKRGQNPKTLVVACCDSRVDPANLFDSHPGDFFVVRNVANLVPPYESGGGTHGVSAALEFAVRTLEVERIIVLGHAQCGGIQALVSGAVGEFIPQWMDIAKKACDTVLAEFPDQPLACKARACEQEAILVSLKNLLTFPWIKERVGLGRLALHGWYFDLEQGEILCYDPAHGGFDALTFDPC